MKGIVMNKETVKTVAVVVVAVVAINAALNVVPRVLVRRNKTS